MFKFNSLKLIWSKMDQICYKSFLIKQFLKSVAAVNPCNLISENLKTEGKKLQICHKVFDVTDKKIHLVGFGKAVLGMAVQCEKILGEQLKLGVISGPHNIQNSFKSNPEFSVSNNSIIQVLEGAENNLPDENAEKATGEIISLVEKLNSAQDHLIVLISGGGSALFTKPKPGISLSEKREAIKLLMESGANINELNTVRKKLSMVKGGGLACLSYPVQTTCLILSDVINDPVDIIASGPTVPSSDLDKAAFNVLQKYNLQAKVPTSVLLETKKSSKGLDIPIENNQFTHVDNFIIGNNTKALNVSKAFAEESGFESIILSNQVKGDVQKVSDFYTKMIFEILKSLNKDRQYLINPDDFIKDCCFYIDRSIVDEINNTIKKSDGIRNICIIAGGEITVQVKGDGKGGRNQELTLMTSIKVENLKKKHSHLFTDFEVIFLFAGTDGQDGPTDAAGALGGPHIIESAKKLNLNISEYLSQNDSYNFFSKINDGSLIKTGYTGTNVMDIHTFLIYHK